MRQAVTLLGPKLADMRQHEEDQLAAVAAAQKSREEQEAAAKKIKQLETETGSK
jgi:hypothetical protein